MELDEKLLHIQQELKAPKNQRNNFGGYNYRSCEDILEAVKPLLKKYNCTLTLSDNIISVGNRFYIEASADLTDVDKPERCIINTAYARESDTKKGMDDSQITGACSSYARKYALNGLFLIDDVKDADATNTHGKASPKQIELVKKLVNDIPAMLKYYKLEKIEDMTAEQASETITRLNNKKGDK